MAAVRRILIVGLILSGALFYMGCGGNAPKAQKPDKLDPLPTAPPSSAGANPPPAQAN